MISDAANTHAELFGMLLLWLLIGLTLLWLISWVAQSVLAQVKGSLFFVVIVTVFGFFAATALMQLVA